MGCTESKVDLMSQDVAIVASCESNGTTSVQDMSDEHFSQGQKTLLRETWALVDGENHGIAIFIKIFDRKPTAKQFFPFKDLSGPDLLNNVTFRVHAKRFMHAIGTTVKNLDALDVALIPILHRLGESHQWIQGFQQEFLPVFMEAILDVIVQELGENCTDEVRAAWIHLGTFLSTKLIEGYTLHSQKRKGTTIKDS